jgi:hypothetical protein
MLLQHESATHKLSRVALNVLKLKKKNKPAFTDVRERNTAVIHWEIHKRGRRTKDKGTA